MITNIKAPLQVTLNVAGKCNLRCVYCYAQPFTGGHMDRGKALALIDEMAELGVFIVKVAGGEPLLHPHILDILTALASKNICASLLTNLTVDQPIIRQVVGFLRENGNISVQVSIDAIDREIHNSLRGGFDQTMENLNYLLSEGIDVQIASVITTVNMNRIGEIIDYFYPRVTRFHVMNLMPTNMLPKDGGFEHYSPSQQDTIEVRSGLHDHPLVKSKKVFITSDPDEPGDCSQEFHYEGCAAGVTFCDIDSNLDVVACNIARKFIIGNLGEASLAEIWSSARALEIRAERKALCSYNKLS